MIEMVIHHCAQVPSAFLVKCRKLGVTWGWVPPVKCQKLGVTWGWPLFSWNVKNCGWPGDEATHVISFSTTQDIFFYQSCLPICHCVDMYSKGMMLVFSGNLMNTKLTSYPDLPANSLSTLNFVGEWEELWKTIHLATSVWTVPMIVKPWGA